MQNSLILTEREEAKTRYFLPQYSTFKTDTYNKKVAIVFSISKFFIKKSSLSNRWMSLSYSNSALETRGLGGIQ